MKHHLPDRMELINRNSDFPGYRHVTDSEETINYQFQSNLRIWYNDVPADCDNHWHDAIEIIYVDDNGYEVISDGISYTLVPGDIIYIPAGVMHAIKAPKTGIRFVYLINASPFRELKDYDILRPLLNKCLLITPSSEPAIYESVKILLEQVREMYFSDYDFREMSIYALIMNIMTTIGRNRLARVNKSGSNHSAHRNDGINRFNEVIEYINDHYNENITLETTAKYFGYSKFYFAKLFKEYFDTTFVNYLSFKRILVAETLLIDTTLSVTEIAFRSGFSSISSFNRCFREIKGCSPTKYKELYQGK